MSKPQIHRVNSDVFDPQGGDRMVIHGASLGGSTEVRVGITEAAITSEPMVAIPVYDGANDLLTAPGTPDTYYDARAVYGWCLCRPLGASLDGYAGGVYINDGLVTGSTTDSGVVIRSSGNVSFFIFGSGYEVVTAALPSNWKGDYLLVQWTFDGTNIRIRVNGGAWSSVAVVSGPKDVNLGGTLHVGKGYSSGGFNGDMIDVGTASAAVSDSDMDNIVAYCNKRYGLSLGGILPSTFDPATLTPTGWWRSGGYTSGTWTDIAGNARHLTEATNPPSVADSTILICTAPQKDAGQYSVTVKNASGRTSLQAAVEYANPGTLPNCIWWLRPDDADVDVDGSTEVTTWRDKSGVGDSNRNVTPPTADNPAWNSADADYGGKPTVGPFNRAGTFRLESGVWSAAASQPFTLGTIMNTAGSGFRESVAQATGNIQHGTTGVDGFAYSGSVLSVSGNVSGLRQMVVCTYDGAGSVLYSGNLNPVTGTTGPASSLGASNVFVGSLNGASDTYGVEKLAELVAWNGAKTLREMRTFRRYRDSYYGQVA